MITDDKITHIFCLADDFCKYFSSELKKHQLSDGKKHRNKPGRLSDAEVITILILFHSKGFRCLKHFYTQYVCKHLLHLFPKTVSYNRFVELQKSVLLSLTVFIKEVFWGLYRHCICWFNSVESLQTPAHTYSQDFQRYSPAGQVLDGMVLRL